MLPTANYTVAVVYNFIKYANVIDNLDCTV